MRKVQKLTIDYCGFKEPENEDELMMEILCLENAIKNAELRISMLKQGLHLNKMMLSSQKVQNEKTIEQTDQKTQ